jgi:predicted Zn finger-like uncharacterized protein
MPLEVSCPSCSGQLRVPDTAAGKKIRCPKCKGAIDVPAAIPESVPAAEQAPAAETPKAAAPRPAAAPSRPAPSAAKPQPKVEQWFLKTEDGEEYGPVNSEELDQWKGEGRITADCQLLREGDDQWQWATDVFPDI